MNNHSLVESFRPLLCAVLTPAPLIEHYFKKPFFNTSFGVIHILSPLEIGILDVPLGP